MSSRDTSTKRGNISSAARAVLDRGDPSGLDWRRIVLRVAGAGLLIATGAIHLDLYVTGYRTIPTIGWLFLLQVIAAFVLGLAVLVIPDRLIIASRLAAAAGALFALATLGGYLLSVWIGLFGFKEVRTTAGVAAGVVEVIAFAVLALLVLAPAPQFARAGGLAAGVLAAAAVVLLGVALAGANSPGPASAGSGAGTAAGLKTATIGGKTVLTNARGFTLYWFAPDTPTSSKCYGSCATYWPPVTGTTAAGSGLPGKVATITRTGGVRQLTYDGHPLYTYIGDTAPGQARGNNLNLNGGLWHVVPASP
jgi:predicted lipoprotein with Yx(FWY)xxD motif